MFKQVTIGKFHFTGTEKTGECPYCGKKLTSKILVDVAISDKLGGYNTQMPAHTNCIKGGKK